MVVSFVAEVFQPKRLVKVAQHLAGDWKLFAAKLKFPQSSIDNFEANAYTQEDRAMAMLTRYRYAYTQDSAMAMLTRYW